MTYTRGQQASANIYIKKKANPCWVLAQEPFLVEEGTDVRRPPTAIGSPASTRTENTPNTPLGADL